MRVLRYEMCGAMTLTFIRIILPLFRNMKKLVGYVSKEHQIIIALSIPIFLNRGSN